MERVRLAGVNGPGGRGSGYAVGGRLVLTCAHVTGSTGTRVTVFHPAGTGIAGGSVVWAGTAGGRDDAALVLVDDSPHWRPPTAPVLWGRPDTTCPGTPCETWGVPDEAQRLDCPIEASHLDGEVNPGSGFVGNQYVMDLRTPATGWPEDGTSPFGGLSGAAVFCDRYLTGVVAADRAHSAHGRLNVVPAYVLHHDPAFRTNLGTHGGGSATKLTAVEFQDLADPAQDLARRPRPTTPVALLEAGRQTVPFHGRQDLTADLTAWCRLDGVGAWLLHGPGGQGKTRLAHHLTHQLTTDGWTVLWPRTRARPEQLLDLRRAAKPLLVVLDYAETRPGQLTALIEAAAEHPGNSPFKLLLLARTDGDWWQQARTATRQAEDYLTTARTHHLTPLENDPDQRADHYREAVCALAAALPFVDGLAGHDWTMAAASLPEPRGLCQDAYGNALTFHMTALADLLDTVPAEPDSNRPAPVNAAEGVEGARNVEDRLLGHESRYWRDSAAALGLTPALSMDTLKTAIAAGHLTGATDREDADHLWRRLPALADQPRDRRDQVTVWLATLYPTPATGGPLWGTLQPDRLAERHVGRTLEAVPRLADHLLHGADDAKAGQLLTVYSRAATHSVFQGLLDAQLTELCVRHHRQLSAHIVTTATRTDHPTPLITALDIITTHPDTSLDTLNALHDQFPEASHRLAITAASLASELVRHNRVLAEADPEAHLPGLANSLNNLAVSLSRVGRWEEGLAAIQEAVTHSRTLAEANPVTDLPGLAKSLNNLAVSLGGVGRWEEGLAAIQEAVAIRRTLAEADPGTYLPALALALNNLSLRLGQAGRQQEGLAAIQEAVTHFRVLAEADPDAHLSDLADALYSLAFGLSWVGRWEEALAVSQEAVTHSRALAEADPDAHLSDLADALYNLSLRLDEVGRQKEGLAAIQEAVTIRRTLATTIPDAYLPDLARSLNNLADSLSWVGRWEEALAAIQEAVAHFRVLAEADPDAHLSDLADALHNLSLRLNEVGRQKEALATIQEAITIRRTLAQDNPSQFGVDLQQSLAMAAWLEGLE
ncbi:tetratricopeptide repeat protein [Kitasatospora sp. NPDC004745]|uniref:tetratricopeptide repeat protein n=1 Tax=Kitasatospora sp. NPDC004745 TaxID=3364019 RepID=UPI0036B905F9